MESFLLMRIYCFLRNCGISRSDNHLGKLATDIEICIVKTRRAI